MTLLKIFGYFDSTPAANSNTNQNYFKTIEEQFSKIPDSRRRAKLH